MTTFTDFLNLLEPHVTRLENIIKSIGEPLEGNCMYPHLTLSRGEPVLLPKQENLYNAAKYGNNILEIGFGAGHSALIFLMSNPDAHLTCIDNFSHKYTQPCLEYLMETFPNRITYHKGDSVKIMKMLISKRKCCYDLFHIDGAHDEVTVRWDIQQAWELAHDDLSTQKPSIVILNDIWMQPLKLLWDDLMDKKMISQLAMINGNPIKQTSVQSHVFGTLNRPKSNIAILSLTVGDQYQEITKYGKRSKIYYALKHGYAFHDDEDVVDEMRGFAWSKVLLILRYLKQYDYVIWIDGDTYIMNPDIGTNIITDYLKQSDILITSDYLLPNTGVIFMKNTDWCFTFWCYIYTKVKFIDHPNWEQGAFIDAVYNDELQAKQHVNIMGAHTQRLFNSYWYNFIPGDFILHLPGCFKYGVDKNLSNAMVRYCPLRRDEQTPQQHQEHLDWINNKSVAEAIKILGK